MNATGDIVVSVVAVVIAVGWIGFEIGQRAAPERIERICPKPACLTATEIRRAVYNVCKGLK